MQIDIIQGNASVYPSTNLQIKSKITNATINGIKHYYAANNQIQQAIQDLGWDFTNITTSNPSEYNLGDNVTIVNLGGIEGPGIQTVNLDLDLKQGHQSHYVFVVVVHNGSIKKPGKRSTKAVSDDEKKK